MISKFNQAYGIPGGTAFKPFELLCMLLQEYDSICLNLFKECALNDGQVLPKQYGIGVNNVWGEYTYNSVHPCSHNTVNGVIFILLSLFLENKDNSKFQEIVKKVYNV